MNCPKCSGVIQDNSKFCEHCGAKIDGMPGTPVQPQVTPAQPQVNSAQPQVNQGQPYGMAQQPKKPVDKKLIAIIIGAVAVAFLLLVLILVFITTHKTKIDLNDYAKVTFDGYDTCGTATVEFDYDAFYKDLSDKAKVKKGSKTTEVSNYLSSIFGENSEWAAYAGMLSDMNWELDKTDGLTNGDKVTINFDYDNDAASEYKIKFVGDNREYKVSGLDKIEEIDAFEGVSLDFSGTSPDAYASVKNESTEDAVSGIYFSMDKSSGLKTGDTVTVTAEYDEDSMLQNYGCKIKESTKEFTVENVDEYITDAENIGDDILNDMKGQTEDVINAYFANNKSEISKSDMKYEGCYFLSRKETDSWYSYNYIYVVYSAKVKSKDKSFKTSTVYFPVEFTNIMKYADGTDYVNLNTETIKGSTKLQYGWWSTVSGYTSQKTMKNELVTANKGNYNDQIIGKLD